MLALVPNGLLIPGVAAGCHEFRGASGLPVLRLSLNRVTRSMIATDGTTPVQRAFSNGRYRYVRDPFPASDTEEMTDEQRAVVDAIQSGPRGAGLRGPFNALLRSPALCDLVQRVGAYVRFGSSIPAPLNELAICMAGRKWGAQYEFYAHRRLGIDAGLNPSILDAVAAGRRPAEMSQRRNDGL